MVYLHDLHKEGNLCTYRNILLTAEKNFHLWLVPETENAFKKRKITSWMMPRKWIPDDI